MRPIRRRMQLIFQDPMASLNPRRTIRRIVLEPMLFHRVAANEADAEARARKIFARFSLPSACLDRYPHELSGGAATTCRHRARRAARARFRVADEIVSGLDVSTQAHVLNLLKGLSRDLGLSMAFISHDLSVVRAVCDRVYVLRSGRIVEEGPVRPRLRRPEGRVYPRASGCDPLAEDRPRLAQPDKRRRERRGIGRREVGRRRLQVRRRKRCRKGAAIIGAVGVGLCADLERVIPSG